MIENILTDCQRKSFQSQPRHPLRQVVSKSGRLHLPPVLKTLLKPSKNTAKGAMVLKVEYYH